MHSRTKLYMLGGGLVAAMVLTYLMVGAMANSESYVTMDQFVSRRAHLGDKSVRLTANVVPNSLQQDPKLLDARFEVSDTARKTILPVYYKGMLPDNFKVSPMVVLDGKIDSHGVFQATSVSTKCPAHYDLTATATAGGLAKTPVASH